jgi:MinD-like ATPase involved in chromosome partitioning or flagellar assembly
LRLTPPAGLSAAHLRPTATLLVASGKGGVGTSTLAAMMATAAAERGERVLLVDATESGGTLHHLFGVRPASSLWMLTEHDVRATDVLNPMEERLTFVAGGTSAGAVAPTSQVDRRTALTRLSTLYSHFDLVVFDGGSRLDTISAINELADPRLLLVTSADRLALAANYALVKSVSANRSVESMAVVANRQTDSLGATACEYLVGACSHFLHRAIDVVGTVPNDPSLHSAIDAGMTLRDVLDESTAMDAVRGILPHTLLASHRFVPGTTAMPASFLSFRRWS